ncbi:MAG: SDR family oxidoreductase, partial [Verrucomicrobia bacterium]|nr:SDR family oxidoreductase [Cytophagales bacterium]
ASNKRHPLGRYGTAEELAGVANFLLSDDSSWMTGQVLHIDGGMSVLRSL